MKYFVIASKKSVEFFNAIGVEGKYALNENDVQGLVSKALECSEVSTLIVSKTVASQSQSIIKNHEEKGILPEVVVLNSLD